MKPILFCSLLALLAPAADAGDFAFTIRFGERYGCGDERHCRRVYEPGRWETVHRRVYIDPVYETRWAPPRFEWRYDRCGNRIRVMVCPGRYERVLVCPGRWETVCERVYVPGRYVYDCNSPGHRHDGGRRDRRDRDDDDCMDRRIHQS